MPLVSIPLFVFFESADLFPLFSASLLWQWNISHGVCIIWLCFHCLCLSPSVLFKLDINMQSIKQLLHGPDVPLNWSCHRNVEVCTNSRDAWLSHQIKRCTFSWFTRLSFYRLLHCFNHEAVLQETDFISDARFESPLQSPVISSSTSYTVTVQHKIAACFIL